MSYVNSPPNASPPPPSWSFWPAIKILSKFLHAPLRARFALGIAVFFAALVTLLALSPTYDGLAGLDLQPVRLIAPLQTYLFRNALVNTAWLIVGVYLCALLLGWTWAITGIPYPARPLLLLPLFMPGALIGLLWRPLFVNWLNLAQAELSLLVIALVLLWRAVPLAAWHFSRNRHAWPKLIPLCALLVLLDADLVLTLTRGEPFNATHTWASWMVLQLWVNRAWGYAASMGAALAVMIAICTAWATQPPHAPIPTPYGSPLGLTATYIWIVGPFFMPLFAFLHAPLFALSDLANLGALLWLVNGALLWGASTFLAERFAWRVHPQRTRRLIWLITLAMLPLTTITLAYLVDALPLLGSPWLLIGISSLFTAGLIMAGDHRPILRRHHWYRVAGYALLVIAHTFPLQMVMQLPTLAWTPALGIVWTLAEASQSVAALGAALLLYGVWAGVGAWLVTRGLKLPEEVIQPLRLE